MLSNAPPVAHFIASEKFTYTDAVLEVSGPPTIASVEPDEVCETGATVTITGERFAASAVVTIGGTAVSGSPVTLTITAGTAASFTLTGLANGTAGASQTVTLTAKDSSNNTVTSYTGTKSVTFSGANVAPAGTASATSARAATIASAGNSMPKSRAAATTDSPTTRMPPGIMRSISLNFARK